MRPPLRLLLHSFMAMPRVALEPIFFFISAYTFFTSIAQLEALRLPLRLVPLERFARRVAREAIVYLYSRKSPRWAPPMTPGQKLLHPPSPHIHETQLLLRRGLKMNRRKCPTR